MCASRFAFPEPELVQKPTVSSPTGTIQTGDETGVPSRRNVVKSMYPSSLRDITSQDSPDAINRAAPNRFANAEAAARLRPHAGRGCWRTQAGADWIPRLTPELAAACATCTPKTLSRDLHELVTRGILLLDSDGYTANSSVLLSLLPLVVPPDAVAT